MNICHLYHETTISLQAKSIVSSFDNSDSFDIAGLQNINHYSIYIIELNKIEKPVAEKIKDLFKNKISPLIYFVVSNNYNLMLFQLAFLLNAKTIITASQDVDKLILKLRSDLKQHEDEHIKMLFAQAQLSLESFLFFKNKQLHFASKKFFEDFECETLDEAEKKICSQFDVKHLLLEDSRAHVELLQRDKKQVNYDINSSTSDNESEKFLFFKPFIAQSIVENKPNFLSSRSSFIEFLQEVLQEKTSAKTYTIMTIHLANFKKLQYDTSKIELEIFLQNFLLHIDSFLDENLIFAQYESDFYTLMYENIEEKDLKTKLEDFQKQMGDFLDKLKFNPNMELFAFPMETLDLESILTILNAISTKNISQEDIVAYKIKYISTLNGAMGDDELIAHLLKNVYVNKTEITLLNIYKGLCINTLASVVKIADNTIYVKFQHLQGMAMKHEKETVLQSSSFSRDIKAAVKFVNIEKQIAILEGFSFLNANANSRKYGRVTCLVRTPIIVTSLGSTLSGEIIDISINSIAIKVKQGKTVESLKGKNVQLSFVLPSKSSADSYVKILAEAKINFIFCQELECKLVCEVLKDNAIEAILMEYIHNRQKEIIAEVKKITKNL